MDRQYKPVPASAMTGTPAGVAGMPGKRTLVEAAYSRGVGAGSPHAQPAATRVAEREKRPLNAVLKIVAYDAHGSVIRAWGAKATWDGPLPQHFHGERSDAGWRWDDASSARSVRVHTRADGTGGQSVEAWAGTLHATRIEIFAEPTDAVTESDQERPEDARDPSAPGHANDARNARGNPAKPWDEGHHKNDEDHAPNKGAPNKGDSGAAWDAPAGSSAGADGVGPDERLAGAIAFEHELGIDIDLQDGAGGDDDPGGETGTGGAGHAGGNPAGRTGEDASTTGQGPGGDVAKYGGVDESSTSTRDNQGTKTGDRDGEHNGSENGRYAGEGRDGDDGVRGAAAIFGGVIAVPTALKGAVELAMLIEAGDVTGAGADLFKAGVGKAMSIAAARRLVAREARIAAEREMHVVARQLATKKAFTSLSMAEQERVLRIAYWEKQRQFFRGYLKAAKAEQRAMRQALQKAKPAERAALETRKAAAQTGEEIAKVEPVAGQLPRNHAYAGHEFPRSQLPAKYQTQGLRFKDTGYPDFEPYAKVLPNGQKKVRIACTGSRRADFAAANRAAGLEETPRYWTWHHDEADLGSMYLIPEDLHRAVKHSGGVAEYKHRHGLGYVD